MEIFVAILFIGVLIAIGQGIVEKEKEQSLKSSAFSIPDFKVSQHYASAASNTIIAIDEDSHKIALMKGKADDNSEELMPESFSSKEEKLKFCKHNIIVRTQKIMAHKGLGLKEAKKYHDEWLASDDLNSPYPVSPNRLILNFSDIIASEIVEDGVSVTSTSRSSQFGGAIAGGLLFGGAGAVVGALTGKTSTANKVSRIDLKVIINNTKSPIWLFNFLNLETTKGSFIYKPAMEKANHWHGLLSVVIRRVDMESQKLGA